MTRILMTTDAVGGVFTYALDLAGGLARQGLQVTLAALGPKAAADQRRAAGRAGVRLVETGLPLDWMTDSAAEVRRAGAALAKLADRTGADLVHLNAPALAAGGAFDRPVVGACHSCVATWWAAVKQPEPLPADFRWRTELLAEGYAACDALVAPSRAFAAATHAVYGRAPKVVRNGRPALAAAPAIPRERRVVAAGRLWDQGKGMATLDAAAARLDAPVVAFGHLQGPHGDTFSPERLMTPGRVSAGMMETELRRSRVFAAPALYEPFGLSVLEAAQAGCALVLSDIPTFRELWTGAALFTPVGDAAALAEALQQLLDDEAQAARLAAAAVKRARRYDLEAMATGMAALYRRLSPAAFAKEAAA